MENKIVKKKSMYNSIKAKILLCIFKDMQDPCVGM